MLELCIACAGSSGKRLEKPWVSSLGLPQVVFATSGLGTNSLVMSSLSERFTQVCAPIFDTLHAVNVSFIHPFHSLNNMNYKKEN